MPEYLNPEHQIEILNELRRKYEEALSNAQKTEDYSEAEKLKEELEERLSDLEAQFSKSELTVKESEPELKEVSEIRAREIMGKDFYGPDEVENAFGKLVGDSYYKTPNSTIPYSEKELLVAKGIGEELIFRAGFYSPTPNTVVNITMKELFDIVKARMAPNELKLISALNENRKEYYFGNDVMKTRWVLVRKNFLAYSKGINYIEQTRVLRDYLQSLGALTKEELQSCDDSILDSYSKMQDRYWQQGTRQLSSLLINQNHRRSPLEAFYDWVLLFKNGHNQTNYDYSYEWTNGLSWNEEIVATTIISSPTFGNITRDHRRRGGNMGVISVR